jgi:formylglycine-generating enzyme
MNGNVWQWTADRYAPNYYEESPKEDPPGPSAGWLRVNRGGGWEDDSSDFRVARRDGANPSLPVTFLGFRIVLLP